MFNRPRGEICLGNHLRVIDGAGVLLLTSLSGAADTVFHEHILWGEISEAVEHYSEIRRKSRART